eukprot:s4537_g3.t1
MTTLSSGDLTKKRICEKAYTPREQQEQLNDEAAAPNRCEADDSNGQDVGIPLTKLGEMDNIKIGLRSFHVASEKKQPKGPRNKVKSVAEEDLLMILLAVFGLAKHRRHWGKRPEETWGVFLELLDDILTSKSERQVTYLQAGPMRDLSLEEVEQVDAEEEDEDESVELDDVDEVESLRLFFEDFFFFLE